MPLTYNLLNIRILCSFPVCLQSENILLTDGSKRACLCDFGFAKHLPSVQPADLMEQPAISPPNGGWRVTATVLLMRTTRQRLVAVEDPKRRNLIEPLRQRHIQRRSEPVCTCGIPSYFDAPCNRGSMRGRWRGQSFVPTCPKCIPAHHGR